MSAIIKDFCRSFDYPPRSRRDAAERAERYLLKPGDRESYAGALFMKFVLIGAGSRGMVYSEWAHENGHEIAAIATRNPNRLRAAGEKLEVPADRLFTDYREMLALGKIADVAIIATMDRQHYEHAMAAMEAGYDLLLEKPISPDPAECLAIEEKAKEKGLRVTVCHVLSYTEFFMTVKRIIDSGELGKIVAIKHSENIGNFHMAHSFVRGNWANSAESSPINLQKSCHDMDILLWLTDSHCTRVASFGSLSYFKTENAPEGSAERCCDCPVSDSCRFDAKKVYLPVLGDWPADMVCLEQTEEAMLEALKTSSFGRCVYRCGNDVCDHMSTILEFENGVTATFSLTAQTNRIHRNIHIMCEHGEIVGDDDEGLITINRFTSNEVETYETRTIHILGTDGGHNGGDPALMRDLVGSFENGSAESRSSVSRSVESHIMAYAAEKSRTEGCVVKLDEYKKELGGK